MPDTRRTKSALATIYADNTGGAIDAQDGRDLLVSCHPENVIQSAAFASRPSSGQLAGDLFLPTDGPYIQRWDGSAWRSWAFGMPVVPPVLADFGWTNQGTATATSVAGTIVYSATTASGQQWRILSKPAPAAPYVITMGFIPRFPVNGTDAGATGLLFRNSTSGKLSAIEIRANSGDPGIGVVNYNSVTSFSTEEYGHVSGKNTLSGPLKWFRIANGGTNLTWAYSIDGLTFETVKTAASGSFLVPDEVGFAVNTVSDAGGSACGVTVVSWKES